eukprot:1047396-Rhodomonas_salina.1
MLSQEQYVKDVLERFGMTGATPVSTPMEANIHLTSADSPAPEQINKTFQREYQRIIGSLMYRDMATFMRPDLAFAVNQCSRYAFELIAHRQGTQALYGEVTILAHDPQPGIALIVITRTLHSDSSIRYGQACTQEMGRKVMDSVWQKSVIEGRLALTLGWCKHYNYALIPGCLTWISRPGPGIKFPVSTLWGEC